MDDMNSYSVPTTKKNPRRIVIQCGTNDISNGTAPNEVTKEIVDLAINLKRHENGVFESSLVGRGDQWNERDLEDESHILDDLNNGPEISGVEASTPDISAD